MARIPRRRRRRRRTGGLSCNGPCEGERREKQAGGAPERPRPPRPPPRTRPPPLQSPSSPPGGPAAPRAPAGRRLRGRERPRPAPGPLPGRGRRGRGPRRPWGAPARRPGPRRSRSPFRRAGEPAPAELQLPAAPRAGRLPPPQGLPGVVVRAERRRSRAPPCKGRPAGLQSGAARKKAWHGYLAAAGSGVAAPPPGPSERGAPGPRTGRRNAT
ncbi:proline-rich protein 2-like [Candoia aspera]|uniref:proline-rich protein 2-like n=1 Tax=Candoia aspera TaxID=51853 RepID=UPI002FD7B566